MRIGRGGGNMEREEVVEGATLLEGERREGMEESEKDPSELVSMTRGAALPCPTSGLDTVIEVTAKYPKTGAE